MPSSQSTASTARSWLRLSWATAATVSPSVADLPSPRPSLRPALARPWTPLPNGRFTYTFVSARVGASVDLSRNVASGLFGAEWNRGFLTWIRRYYHWVVRLFRLGALGFPLVLALPAEDSKYVAIAVFTSSIPSLLCSIGLMSRDVFALLLRNHEFLISSLLNALNWGILMFILNDLRAIAVLSAWTGIQLALASDALFRTVASFFRTLLFAVPALVCVGLLTFLGRVESPHENYAAFHLGQLRVHVVDIFLNSSATMAVFAARVAFKRRHVLSEATTNLITCVIVKDKLRLQGHFQPSQGTCGSVESGRPSTNMSMIGREESTDPSPPQAVAARDATTSGDRTQVRNRRLSLQLRSIRGSVGRRLGAVCEPPVIRPLLTILDRSGAYRRMCDPLRPHLQQLHAVPFPLQTIDARATLIPCLTRNPSAGKLPLYSMTALYGCGITGLVLTVVAVLVRLIPAPPNEPHAAATRAAISVGGLGFSLIYLTVVVSHFQRSLLRRLLRNFDVLFLSWQLVTGSIALGFLIDWDERTWCVLSWNLWFHTVILLDALPPHARRQLGIRKRHGSAIVFAVFLCVLSILTAMTLDPSYKELDVTVFRVTLRSGHSHAVTAQSYLINRVVPIAAWSVRLLWELGACPEAELVFLQSSIEYYCPLEMFPASVNRTRRSLSIAPSVKQLLPRNSLAALARARNDLQIRLSGVHVPAAETAVAVAAARGSVSGASARHDFVRA